MASAYIKDEQGGTFIPASQRPDGTWRKPRRVKDGYVPQEEVPLYESKGKQFVKNLPTYPIGMSPEYVAAHKAKREAQVKTSLIPGLMIQTETKKKKKKNKNKSVESVSKDLSKTTISEREMISKSPVEASVDPTKRLRNLRKKIREIEALELKIKNGDIKSPEKEVVDKISRKKEIQQEIKQFEAKQ
ncbi:partner of Y14 and mago isoform X1 [Cephus cinctus]|uniref:Partner of Y14 and mago n=1 Tax=Cephus cinctus TaxID=211228 RepID=A0AAJ7FQK8_CEPCN|nr:partner of Y14 and mago isoform X1 [Cephus cinctus]